MKVETSVAKIQMLLCQNRIQFKNKTILENRLTLIYVIESKMPYLNA